MKTDRRLILIGPVFPFRGGIAQHTTMLKRALEKETSLGTISFTRLYPKWLFPGASDREEGKKDAVEPGVHYLIDSLNPLTWFAAARFCIKFKPDIVVIPWWTIYWTFCFWYLARRFRRADIPVIFLCHNVIEHESTGWKVFLTKLALGQTDRFMVHTRQDEKNLAHLLPGSKISRHPLPLFDQFPKPARQLARRAALELFFFGFVRPYKGLDLLIDALHLARLPADFFLTIAGEFWQGKKALIQQINEKALQDRIEIIDRYLPEQEAADLFQRADLVVLPYRSATGSGVIPLAYHYNKPVLVTPVGGLPEVVIAGESGFIAAEPTAASIARCLEDCRGRLQDRERILIGINRAKKNLSWENFVRCLLRSN
jgi:glycosyltransferase involved in cell wall biosynthesis